MSWDNDIDELTTQVLQKYDLPEEYKQAVRYAVLLGLQRSTDNWVKKKR